MKLLTNKQDPRNRIIVVDAYINGDRIVCDANSDDFDLWEDCWTIEDLEDEPINPFDTKLFQDGVKREDERIMKIITDSIFYGAGVEYKDVLDYLAYLEKQKEQQPAEYLDLDNASQDYVYNHFCQGADFTPDYIKGLMEDAFIDGANWQKEQKPANGVDYDISLTTNDEPSKLKAVGNVYDNIHNAMEQKPAEWSEDDENNLELVIDCIYKFYPDPVMKYKLKEWLKSLRPVKQEWSEEDERILKGIIGLIDHDQHYGVSNNEMISWLKSLRPSKDCSSCAKHLEGYISGRSDAENKLLEQFGALVTPEDELHIKPRWKPSEEQMKALYCALNDAISLYSDKVSPLYEEISRTHFDALESLYNDLKKLI